MLRIKGIFKVLGMSDFKRCHIEIIGEESNYGKNRRSYGVDGEGPRETVLWMAVEHNDKNALGVFSREIAAAGTGTNKLIRCMQHMAVLFCHLNHLIYRYGTRIMWYCWWKTKGFTNS